MVKEKEFRTSNFYTKMCQKFQNKRHTHSSYIGKKKEKGALIVQLNMRYYAACQRSHSKITKNNIGNAKIISLLQNSHSFQRSIQTQFRFIPKSNFNLFTYPNTDSNCSLNHYNSNSTVQTKKVRIITI